MNFNNEIVDERSTTSETLSFVVYVIQRARQLEIVFLLSQLPLYCYHFDEMSIMSLSLLFLTNFMSLFVIFLHAFKLDIFEINRLTALWNNDDCQLIGEKWRRIQCLMETFSLTIFSTLRYLLANLDSDDDKFKSKLFLEKCCFDWSIQSTYAAGMILTAVENISLFACIILYSSTQKIFRNINLVPLRQPSAIRQRRAIFQSIAPAA